MFKCPFSSKKCNSNSAARVVDGKLILSFPKAVTPVVWQVDLSDVKASRFEIVHDEKASTYALHMIKPTGKPMSIAEFADQDSATIALMDTADALTQVHSGSGSCGSNNSGAASQGDKKQPSTFKTIIWTVLVLLALLFIVPYIIGRSAPAPNPINSGSSVNTSRNNIAPVPAAAGVPVSADDFLRGQ